MCVALWTALLAAAILAPLSPLVASLGLCLAALYTLRLHPRKVLDITWYHLFAALRYSIFAGSQSREALEADIARRWSPKRSDGMVFLSARTGMDLLFSALNLPKGSEVLFWPGITIPAVMEIVKEHGLRVRGAELQPGQHHLAAEDLDKHLTPETKVLVVTHLFGTVCAAGPVIKEARSRGLFVIEDVAQSFVGAGLGSQGGELHHGFRGHEESDAAFCSFGIIKTLTALGGGAGHVRDANLRKKMQDLSSSYPVRPVSQFFKVVLKASLHKLITTPCLWGLAASAASTIGIDFDAQITKASRGFSNKDTFKQRPSLPLLRLLQRRLREEYEAGIHESCSVYSTLAARTETGSRIAEQLKEAGVEVFLCTFGETRASTWWLLSVLDDEPERLVCALHKRGFDATCTSSQLKSVAGSAGGASSSGPCSSTAAAMGRIVYLPLSPHMTMVDADMLAAAVIGARREFSARDAKTNLQTNKRDSPGGRSSRKPGLRRKDGSRRAFCVLFIAACLAIRPAMVLGWLPSFRMTIWFAGAFAIATAALIVVLRRLASTPELRVSPEFLQALNAKPRPEGVSYCQDGNEVISERIDGAVILTGATGFVGGATLFMLLARARELGISRIVVLIRRKSGLSVEQRLRELRENKAFGEVQELFDELVVPLEGDIAMPGWVDQQERQWPHAQPLRAVLHCAADVRFDQRLQAAAVSSITASLQAAQIATRWGARRFVYVSTAFVHAVPSLGNCLGEHLVELRDFDPNELYKDIVADGLWAEKAMKELGFPNTYTFTKALAEHLVIRACASAKLDARIVRPSIITPAWAAPWAGWCGDKPSTSPIVAGALLLQRRAVRIFAGSDDPTPMVPVDFVAETIVRALLAPRCSQETMIMNAAVDSSEAAKVPSFRSTIMGLIKVLALSGEMSLQEAGLLARLLRDCRTDSQFWFLHTVFNVFPGTALSMTCTIADRLAAWLPGYDAVAWESRCSGAKALKKYGSLPAQYLPFSSPQSPWLFSSSLRLPSNWDSTEYLLLIYRASASFAAGRGAKDPLSAPAFSEVRVTPPKSAWLDILLTFGTPGASFVVRASAMVVRRVLVWMDLTVTVDAASLLSVTKLAMPLILCPTHRSLLDFVIIGSACFQLHPILPTLQMPHVAADAEFSGLPFLGHVLKALGAFFVRRGGGSVQPDPALRAEVGRVFKKGRPIEVFLEGGRTRGRRHLKLRKGFLKVLRDVSQRNVALVPMALSYELLPEDSSFYDEMQGIPRPPLRVLDLLKWVLRALRGELPSYGAAHMRLGTARVLDTDSNLGELLCEIQDQHVKLTAPTALHARALAEVLDLSPAEVVEAFRAEGLTVRRSCISKQTPLSEAERWALALQAATALRIRLPGRWASWLVEPSVPACSITPDEGDELGEATCGVAELDPDLGLESESVTEEQEAVPMRVPAACSGDDHSSDILNKVVSALSTCLCAAQEAASAEAVAMKEGGVQQLTEEHLYQQLLKPQRDRERLPPVLARGAAHIVAASWLRSQGQVGSENAVSSSSCSPAVVPLWPVSQAANDGSSNEQALERWGFKDTRFVGQWVDGRQAIRMTSMRYGKIGSRPLYRFWSFWQSEFLVHMSVRDTLPELPLPDLPAPAASLLKQLRDALPEARVSTDVRSRLRVGTGHCLADIWRLRSGEVLRMPDAVVRPINEQEVLQLLQAASGQDGFAVIPVGGRTNVTSATGCPALEVDPRPFVAVDMTGMASVKWVKQEDGIAFVEAGITGTALKEALNKKGVNMGMEPDSMELSTLGGWIATKASGMKRSRYGNIEDMVIEVRVVTPAGILWQHHGEAPDATGLPTTAFGRTSTNTGLPGLVLGSEGCLGVIVAAVVRVTPVPEVVEYESVIFPSWDKGAKWMREVARLPAALRPASCRLMDSKQLRLARAINEDPSKGQLSGMLKEAYLHLRGVSMDKAAATTLVFEGSRDEVTMQKRSLQRLLKDSGGLWGGAASGEAGYALTYAICYIRDFGLDHQILSESLETMVPWSAIHKVWPAVVAAVEAEHSVLRLPGRPFLSCRMTQLYDEGGVLYMYMAVCTAGLTSGKALDAFHHLEGVARKAVLREGGCLSHHHGVGKHRAALLGASQAPAMSAALRGLKLAMDPGNVFGARNGAWAEEGCPVCNGTNTFHSEPCPLCSRRAAEA